LPWVPTEGKKALAVAAEAVKPEKDSGNTKSTGPALDPLDMEMVLPEDGKRDYRRACFWKAAAKPFPMKGNRLFKL